MSEEAKVIVRRVVDEVWNAHNPAKVDELFAPTFVNHDPNAPMVADRAAFKQYVGVVVAGFPDLHVTIEDMVAERDEVAKRYQISGTHQGDWMGLSPTGRLITTTGTTIYRVSGDQVVELWGNTDALGMLQQLGVIPTQA